MSFKGYFFILILAVSGCTTYQLEPVVEQATEESPKKYILIQLVLVKIQKYGIGMRSLKKLKNP